MINPFSAETLALIEQFLTHFSALQYKNLSLPRILILDFVKFIMTVPEDILSLNHPAPIPLNKLQETLNPDYPEPRFKRGKIIINGWLTDYIPDAMKYLCLNVNFNLRTSISKVEIQKVLRLLNQLLASPNNLPLFSEPSFKTWLKQQIVPLLMAIESISNQIANYEPSCIAMLGNHYSLAYRIIGEYAKNARIPTLAYPPHTLLGTSDSYFGFLTLPLITYIYTPWGEEFKKWLLKFGVPSRRIIPVGCPRFDSYPKPSGLNKKEIRRIMDFDEMDYLVVADQQTKQKEAVFRMIWDAVKDDPSIGIVVKLHPHYEQFISDYQKWCNHSPRVKFIPPLSLSLEDLLNGDALALITYFSTVGVEAAYYRVPVITAVFDGIEPGYLFHKNGGSIPVNSPQALAKAIHDLRLNQKYRDQIIQKQQGYLNYVTIPDGKAGQRFFGLLKMMAEGGNPLSSV